MAHLKHSYADEIEFRSAAEINIKKKKKGSKQQSFFGIREAFLGYCPMCDGEVFGAVDSAKCSHCGWTNLNSKYGWE